MSKADRREFVLVATLLLRRPVIFGQSADLSGPMKHVLKLLVALGLRALARTLLRKHAQRRTERHPHTSDGRWMLRASLELLLSSNVTNAIVGILLELNASAKFKEKDTKRSTFASL